MVLNITTTGIVESTIIFGIVHTIWLVIKYVAKVVWKLVVDEVRRERNRIIKHHVKAGHDSPLKHCMDVACASLRSPQPVQPLVVQPEVVAPDTAP